MNRFKIQSAAWLCYLVMFLCGVAGFASAQTASVSATSPRVALVIANSRYVEPTDALPGARRDGQTMQKALESVGFKVALVENATKAQMESAVRAFQRDLRNAGPAAVGFFYYAGHGTADRRRQDNFLLPVDLAGVASEDVDIRGLGVRWITDLLRGLDERPAIAIVIDACRSVSEPTRGGGTSASGQMGMLDPDEISDRGYLVAHSTGKGQIASDAGHFAEALAGKLVTRGLSLDQVFELVRQDVAAKTRVQMPTFRSSLVAKVCLAGCAGGGGSDALARFLAGATSGGDLGQIAAAEDLIAQSRSFAEMRLPGIYLRGAKLPTADFRRAELEGADLRSASLDRANLAAAQLGFANLTEATLQGADLTEARFYFADAPGGRLVASKGERSNWLGANLVGANFSGAKLAGASFLLADLRDADFSGADLSGAYFIGANLQGARFAGATVNNTDLTGAIGDASKLFDAAQRSALCATAVRDGGVVTELYDQDASLRTNRSSLPFFHGGASIANGLSNLDRCRRRTVLAAGQGAIIQSRPFEEVNSLVRLRFPGELLSRGDRQRLFVERAKLTGQAAAAWAQGGPWISVARESEARLTRQLRTNLGQSAAPRGVVSLDPDVYFLYVLRDISSAAAEADWRTRARSEMPCDKRSDAQLRQERRWASPCFLPDEVTVDELTTEQLALFQEWTLRRARALPAEMSAGTVGINFRLRAYFSAPQSHKPDDSTSYFPLEALAPEASRLPQSTRESDAQRIIVVDGGLLRLPRPRTAYRFNVAVEDRSKLTWLDPRLTMTVRPGKAARLRKSDLSASGLPPIDVLDVDITEMTLVANDGSVVATWKP